MRSETSSGSCKVWLYVGYGVPLQNRCLQLAMLAVQIPGE